jgi:Uma2 family endonuclease
MNQKTTDLKTVDDYKQLQEGAPFELINGQLTEEPSPSYSHQELLLQLANQIRNHLQNYPLGEVQVAPLDVFFDEHNVLQPDIIFIAKNNNHIVREEGIYGTPDLIIEVLSPSTAHQDMNEKKLIYEAFGVKEYWLVDSKDREAIGYTLQNGQLKETFRGKDELPSSLLNTALNFPIK